MNWNFGVSLLFACMAMPVLAQDSTVTANTVVSPVISDSGVVASIDSVMGSSIDTMVLDTPAVAPPLAPLSEPKSQDKSIFSQENEVNLSALLTRDTTLVSVYNARKALLTARIAQIDSEVQVLYAEFALKHPLTAKGEFETQATYEQRQSQWKKDNQAKKDSIQEKYNEYRTRLLRAIEVLEDYALTLEAVPKTRALDISGLTLQSYNADAGKYSLVAQSSDPSFSFRYEGFLAMNLEEAKIVNKQTTGMDMALVYYDVPVDLNGTPVYPALNSIAISKAGKKLATEGAFVLPPEWQGNVQIMAANKRADSLRKGLLVPRKLNAAYALDYKTKARSTNRTWMYVARGVLFVAGAAGLSYGYLQQRDADDLADQYDPINQQDGIVKLQEIRDKEAVRNNSYIAGSVLMLAGVVTFAF